MQKDIDMSKRTRKCKYDPNFYVDNEFRCDNIFKTTQKQPYLETTQAGKWGRGRDDMPVNAREHPDINNPLPY